MELIKNCLRMSFKFVFSKKGLIFYVLFSILSLPFSVEWIKLVPLILISLLSLPIQSEIFPWFDFLYIGTIILIIFSFIFFFLLLFVQGTLILSVYNSSIKRISFTKYKRLVLGSLLIVIINFLLYTPYIFFFRDTEPKDFLFFEEFKVEKIIKTTETLIWSIPLLEQLSRFSKPILPLIRELPSLELTYLYLFLNISILLPLISLLISLLFIFLLQEIVIQEQSLISSLRKCWAYFSKNLPQLISVWLISSFIYCFGMLTSIPLSFLFTFSGYFIEAFLFLFILVFQTYAYIVFKSKKEF